MKLADALDAITHLTGTDVSLQRISGALTNAVYKINNAQQAWCLRINHQNEHQLGLDRSSEQAVLQLIADKPWAPKVCFAGADIMLTQWHAGQPLENTSTLPEVIATLMNEVQTIEPSADVRVLDIKKQITGFLTQQPELPEPFKVAVERAFKLYSLPEQKVLCHHDWHSGNLLMSQANITLLDWEYSAIGDPLIDIACAVSGFQLSATQSAFLLKALNQDETLLPIALCLVELMGIAWYGVRFPNQTWHEQQQAWSEKWQPLLA